MGSIKLLLLINLLLVYSAVAQAKLELRFNIGADFFKAEDLNNELNDQGLDEINLIGRSGGGILIEIGEKHYLGLRYSSRNVKVNGDKGADGVARVEFETGDLVYQYRAHTEGIQTWSVALSAGYLFNHKVTMQSASIDTVFSEGEAMPTFGLGIERRWTLGPLIGFAEGGWQYAFIDKLEPESGTYEFDEARYSGFYLLVGLGFVFGN